MRKEKVFGLDRDFVSSYILKNLIVFFSIIQEVYDSVGINRHLVVAVSLKEAEKIND